MSALEIIELAKKRCHLAKMKSSADILISEAENLLEKGLEETAKRKACMSLRYSLGIFSEEYKKACESI